MDTAASVGPSPAVKSGIKAIDRELSALDQADVTDVERTRLEAIARKHAADCAGLLKKHPAQGRSILAKVLRSKLEFKPERLGQTGRALPGPRVHRPAADRTRPGVSRAGTSPMPASWNQIVPWLRQIDGLRAA